MFQINTANARLVYDNAANLLSQAGYDVSKAKLTQSAIRSEVAQALSSRFHIPISVNDQQNGSAFASEKRLQLTDVFIVSSIAVFVAAPASSSVAAGLLYTYGNSTVFSGANEAAGVNAALCNGYITGLIDNDQVLPYWPTYQHLRVPDTQNVANQQYTASGISLTDSNDLSTDGAVPCEPNLILSGNANFDFSFNIINAPAAFKASSRWVFIFGGVLAQNCSKIAN